MKKDITKKLLIGTLSSALLFIGACANTTGNTTANTAPVESSDTAKHTLWEVKGKNNTVFLLGSIHVLSEEYYPLPSVYTDAFEEAEKVVFEIDMANVDETAIAQATQQLGLYLDGSKLSNHISAEDYAKISALAAENEVPQPMVDVMEPWLSYLSITMMKMQQLGYTGEQGIDKYFEGLATKAGKPILAFETADQQLRILDSVPHDEQVDLLINTLEELDETEANFKRMVNAWVTGDKEEFHSLFIEELEEFDGFYDLLIAKRNNDWVEQMQPMLNDSDDYLIVVGAGHLYGPDGLPEQLKGLGYQVTQQ